MHSPPRGAADPAVDAGQDTRARWRTSAPYLVLAIAWAVQALRALHGLDFNDEMQYYGEIVSLVEHGRLFATDLFVQQLVYLLLYPLFKPLILLWGSEHLILAGRILFAMFVMWIYGWVRRALTEAGVPAIPAALAALALTFAIPIYNIYAFSYNTVGLGITALCFAELVAWRCGRRVPRIVFWALAIAVLLLVYPPLGLAVAAVLCARLIVERDFASLARIGICTGIAALAIAAIVLSFTTLDDLLQAVAFTRAMGSGAASLRFGWQHLLALWLVALVLFAIGRLPMPDWARPAGSRGVFAAVVLVAAFALFAAHWAIQRAVWPATLLMAASGLVLTWWTPGREARSAQAWITLLFVVVGTIMVVTSGNGFMQIQGAAMLAAPFFGALAAIAPPAGQSSPFFRSAGARVFGFAVVAVFATLYLTNPYRDLSLWEQNASAEGAPAFRHLRITRNKAEAVAAVRNALAGAAAGSRVLVVGAHPWIYFATDTRPDTDMIFMHFTGSVPAYEILATRLLERRPQYIVAGGPSWGSVSAAVVRIAETGKYECDSRPTSQFLQSAVANLQTYYAMPPTLIVCWAGAPPPWPR